MNCQTIPSVFPGVQVIECVFVWTPGNDVVNMGTAAHSDACIINRSQSFAAVPISALRVNAWSATFERNE